MAKVNLTSFVKKLQRQSGNAPAAVSLAVEIGKYDETVILEALSDDDVEAVERMGDPDNCKSDKARNKLMQEQLRMIAYLGSPTIREAAVELLRLEAIKEPLEIMNKFSKSDIAAIATKVGELTAKANEPTIKEVEQLKN